MASVRKDILDTPKHPLWILLDPVSETVDKDMFRLDAVGNVLCRTAVDKSVLSWDVDHCFPWIRGGKSDVSNFHLLHWDANRNVKNDLIKFSRESLTTGLTRAAFNRAFTRGHFYGLPISVLSRRSHVPLLEAYDERFRDFLTQRKSEKFKDLGVQTEAHFYAAATVGRARLLFDKYLESKSVTMNVFSKKEFALESNAGVVTLSEFISPQKPQPRELSQLASKQTIVSFKNPTLKKLLKELQNQFAAEVF